MRRKNLTAGEKVGALIGALILHLLCAAAATYTW